MGGLDWLALPPVVAFPGFIVVHAVITVSLVSDPRAPVWLALHAALLLGALVFWLPVLGQARRLGDAGRSVCLMAGPVLVWMALKWSRLRVQP